jgi:adenine-specific DNA methylase
MSYTIAKVINDSLLMYMKILNNTYCTNALDERNHVESAMKITNILWEEDTKDISLGFP